MNLREVRGLKAGDSLRVMAAMTGAEFDVDAGKQIISLTDLNCSMDFILPGDIVTQWDNKAVVVDLSGTIVTIEAGKCVADNVKLTIRPDWDIALYVQSKIADIIKMSQGQSVRALGVLNSINQLTKADGSPYWVVTMNDDTGSMEFPLWSQDEYHKITVGDVYYVAGTLSFYNNSAQIKNPVFYPARSYKAIDFLPKYDTESIIPYLKNAIISIADEKYRLFAMQATGLNVNEDRWTSLISAPAAKKNHHAKIGGLLVHTVSMMKIVESILENYNTMPVFSGMSGIINRDRLLVKTILHDIKKVDEYEYKTSINRKDMRQDHIVMGVAYIHQVNAELNNILPFEEVDSLCYSIMSHHGQYGGYEPKTIEDFILHMADMIDSRMAGCLENKTNLLRMV